ncbi:MAG: hypothetical protein ACYTGG_10035 [Planctomycetota bacterium]
MPVGSLRRFRLRDDERPSVLHDLRSGAAPWPLRLGLTFVASGVVIAAVLAVLGLIEMSTSRLQDEHVALGLAMAGAAWCGATTWIWAGHRRARRVILSCIGVVGVWAVAIPLCVLIEEMFSREDLLIASCIVVAIAASILIVTISAYRGIEGRAIQDDAGRVNVNCPRCGYSMVGLESCQCPECGMHYTLDQLIRAQEYGAVRRTMSSSPPAALDPRISDGMQARPALPRAPVVPVGNGSHQP